ncbi:hypothetical protein SK128_014055 [Halocaridina rubra]|uniref:PHD-type domain-containing protein n=1 Tax=Halocaridina rubra TaxID=373956 RepID=A0AAN9A2R7_HALRR
MSVDGSRSGTVTPIGLSEAPSPVDSKAPSPDGSGLTSPIIDTGQIKTESKSNNTEAVVEKVKEKLSIGKTSPKLEENTDLHIANEKQEQVKKERLENNESDIRGENAELPKNKEDPLVLNDSVIKDEAISKSSFDADKKKSDVIKNEANSKLSFSADKEKSDMTKDEVNSKLSVCVDKKQSDVAKDEALSRSSIIADKEKSDVDKEKAVSKSPIIADKEKSDVIRDESNSKSPSVADKEKSDEITNSNRVDNISEDKPLPVNKDAVMRERDKSPDKSGEVKKSDAGKSVIVGENIGKQNEEVSISKPQGTEAKNVHSDEKVALKLPQGKSLSRKNENSETESKTSSSNQSDVDIKPNKGLDDSYGTAEEKEKSTESKVSELKEEALPLKSKIVSDNMSVADKAVKPPCHTSDVSVPKTPLQRGSKSVSPVQSSKDRPSDFAASDPKAVMKTTPSSKSASPVLVPSRPDAPSLSPSGFNPLSPTFKDDQPPPLKKNRIYSLSQDKTGIVSPTSTSISTPSVPFGNNEPLYAVKSEPLAKTGPHSPTSSPACKSGSTIPKTVSISKDGSVSTVTKGVPIPLVPHKGDSVSSTSPPEKSIRTSTAPSSSVPVRIASTEETPIKTKAASKVENRDVSQSYQSATSNKSEQLKPNDRDKSLPKSHTDGSETASVTSQAKMAVKMSTSELEGSNNGDVNSETVLELNSGLAPQNTIPVYTEIEASDKLAASIPPFPPVSSHIREPATPKEVSLVTSYYQEKLLPSLPPVAKPEAIPTLYTQAPPVETSAPFVPSNTEVSSVSDPFPPAPGSFPSVSVLTLEDIPPAKPLSVCEEKSTLYYDPPVQLPPNSAVIPTPQPDGLSVSKILNNNEAMPSIPRNSNAVPSPPFPSIPTSLLKDKEILNPVPDKLTPVSKSMQLKVNTDTKTPVSKTSVSSTGIPLSSKSMSDAQTPSPEKDKKDLEPPTKRPRVDATSSSESHKESPKEKLSGLAYTLNQLKRAHAGNSVDKKEDDVPGGKVLKRESDVSHRKIEDSARADVGSKKTEIKHGSTMKMGEEERECANSGKDKETKTGSDSRTENAEKNLIRNAESLVAKKESKEGDLGSHNIASSLAKRESKEEDLSNKNTVDIKDDINKREKEMQVNKEKQEKIDETPKKSVTLSRGTLFGLKRDSSLKSGHETSSSTSGRAPTSSEKQTSEPTRKLLKPHNFNRESSTTTKDNVSSRTAPTSSSKLTETSAVEKSSLLKKDGVKEPCVGEAIEEPLMIVKGEGEGAKCESGNELFDSYKNTQYDSSKPWWECFDNNSCKVFESHETIEESVMYFWGDGNGADCDAGNNGDETETKSETKQSESGTSTLVASGTRSSPAQGSVKSQKEKERSKPEGENKEVDRISESDEAKVNGLRTLESVDKSDKVLNPPEKTDNSDKLPGINGKKSKDDNDVSCDKSAVTSRNSKNKKVKNVDKEGVEVEMNDIAMSKKENSKVSETCDKQQDLGKRGKRSNVDLNKIKKSSSCLSEEKENSREVCGKRGTRNRASLEELKDDMEESEEEPEEEEGEDEEMAAEVRNETPARKRRGRPKRSNVAVRGRKARTRSSSHRASDEEEPINEEGLEEPTKKRRQRGKGSTARPLPDVPRQRSARIAKIREKEEEERRHLEALRMKQLAEENRLKEIKRKAREERRALREIKKGKREKKEKKDKEKKKKKRKKRGRKKTSTGDPWANSSSSSSSSSEDEEMEEDEEDEVLEFKSDHEFSPESDVEDQDAQPIRRARTAKKDRQVPARSKNEEKEEEEEEEEESEEDQTHCTKCGHDDHPETILLCDTCDAGWHLSCLRPPLLSVPEGDWLCPACEHVALVKKLKELLESYDECEKRAQTEELRKQRLAFVNVSLDNIITEGGKKKKKKRIRLEGDEEEDEDESGTDSDSDDSDSESDDSSDSSSESSSESDAPLYTLRARSARTLKEQVEDFDEMINEAIRDEMEAAAGAGNAGRGKDIDNIIQANEEEACEKEEEVEEKEDEKENEVPDNADDDEKKESEEAKRERETDEDEEEVAPKRKRRKSAGNASDIDDEDYKASDEHPSDSEEEVKTRKRIKPYNMFFKKRRRLTDLDAEDDDDASDEDFMNTSEEEEEESEESAISSSSLATEVDSDDSDVIGGKRRRSSRYDNVPLRRSTRNRGGRQYDEDSDEDRYTKRSKKKKKRRKTSTEEEEEESSDSESSYKHKKKINQRKRKPPVRSKGKKGSKKAQGKKKQAKGASKVKTKSTEEEAAVDKPAKPRIKYAKPPKSKDEDEEEPARRVTRGRQVNYCFLMSDETEEEEPQKKWRGKVMKGERVPTESSEYEASDDEMKKRRGVSGGLGRGKVMKGEEEDDDDDMGDKSKKKRGRPKKGDELIGKPSPPRPSTIKPLIGKPSPPRPSTIKPTPVVETKPASPVTATVLPSKQTTQVSTPPSTSVSTVQTKLLSPTAAKVLQAAVSPSHASLLKSTSITITPARPKPSVNTPFTTVHVTKQATTPTAAASLPSTTTLASKTTTPPQPTPSAAPPPVTSATFVTATASPAHRTLEPSLSSSPVAPVSTAKGMPASVVTASNIGNNSPGHQPPIGKWSPHLPGVTITNVSVSNTPGTPPRPNVGSAPGSGTPPRPALSGSTVTASPPPPYRSSPLPMTPVGRGAPPVSTAPSSLPPVGPPNASSPHSAPYPPYRPPPDHYQPHPAKERFPSHPAFADYAPGRHSPNPHGVPPRHPSHIPSGHSLPHMPAGYGPPGPGSYPPGGVPPPHAGVLRGPPHDLYRPPHSAHPSHGSPSHPGHPHLVMKPGYHGIEPLPYAGSPGPSPGAIGMHQGSQDSPAHHSPNEDSKDGSLPASKAPGEFSSGLMSYFSSQRDDDVE